MNDLLVQLFGLSALRPGEEGVRFALERPMPAWGWAVVTLAAAGFAAWSYSRLVGPRAPRAVLAGVRWLTLLVLVLLAAGPHLIRENRRVERDWVVVLLDRSASMTIPDAPGRRTRDEQLSDALRRSWPAWQSLADEHNILWLGFDAGAYDLASDQHGVRLSDAEGRRTAIGAALAQAAQRVAARPVSGIVIVSDGRSADEPDRTLLRRLRAERIGIYAVPLGSATPSSDLAVTAADAPTAAFVRDTVPVTVTVEQVGGGDATPAVVRLIDERTGRTLDERRVEVAEGTPTEVVLFTRPEAAGEARWSVRVIPDVPDLSDANNARSLTLELDDSPLRVVYFDGYPRWEYRYVKDLLVREESIRSSATLLATSRRSIQEGDVALTRMPRSTEDWAEFDAVILGDLRSDNFSAEQLENLRDHVANRGGGLLWIAGPGATPESWRNTPLADLLPFTLSPRAGASGLVRSFDGPVTMARTERGERLGVLRLDDAAERGWPAHLSDPATGWSLLRWAQRLDRSQLKPTAEVLAVALPASEWTPDPLDRDLSSAPPLVVTMRYGAGRVVYVATDETWRWRYGRGEALTERFWLPLVRLLGRDSLARGGRAAVIEASPPRAAVDQAVQVSLRLADQSLADLRPASLRVRVEREPRPGEPPAPPVRLTLAPDEATPAGAPGAYTATWVPAEPGVYRVVADDPILAGLALSAEVRVALPDDELRTPQADHATLAALAEQTDGAVIQPDALADLTTILPNRELILDGTPDVETLWDRPIVLAILVFLLTIEWVGRRLIRLA